MDIRKLKQENGTWYKELKIKYKTDKKINKITKNHLVINFKIYSTGEIYQTTFDNLGNFLNRKKIKEKINKNLDNIIIEKFIDTDHFDFDFLDLHKIINGGV